MWNPLQALFLTSLRVSACGSDDNTVLAQCCWSAGACRIANTHGLQCDWTQLDACCTHCCCDCTITAATTATATSVVSLRPPRMGESRLPMQRCRLDAVYS